jgi:hypothetical protein
VAPPGVEWFPQLYDLKLLRPSWEEIEPSTSASASCSPSCRSRSSDQRLHDEFGLEVSLASLRRYVTARFRR